MNDPRGEYNPKFLLELLPNGICALSVEFDHFLKIPYINKDGSLKPIDQLRDELFSLAEKKYGRGVSQRA